MYELRPYVEAGGLISYGPDINDIWRRAAVFVEAPERSQASGSARRAAHQARAGDQPQDRQGPRPNDSAGCLGAGGRGHSITMRLARVPVALLAVLSLLAAPLATGAQQAGKIPRVGYLWLGPSGSETLTLAGLRQGFRELGYV